MRGFAWLLMAFSLLSRAILSRALQHRSTTLAGSSSRVLVTKRLMASNNTNNASVRLVSPAKNDRIGKVLMLHGWAQNAWVFKSKSKGITRYVDTDDIYYY